MEPVREDEMKAYEPTMRERIASGLQSAFEGLGANRYKARQRAQTITGGQSSNLPLGMGVADVVSAVSLPATMAMAPIYAEEGIRDIKSAGQAAGRGDYVGAGVEGLFGALNLLPAVSGVTGLAKKAMGSPLKPLQLPETPPMPDDLPRRQVRRPDGLSEPEAEQAREQSLDRLRRLLEPNYQRGGAVKAKVKDVFQDFLKGSAVQERVFRGTDAREMISNAPYTHFSKSPDVANTYAGYLSDDVLKDTGLTVADLPIKEGAAVFPAHVSIQKPAGPADVSRIAPDAKTVQEAFPALQAAGYDGYIDNYQVVPFDRSQIRSALEKARGGAVKEKVKEGVRGALERIQPMVNRLNMSFKDVTKRVPELTQAAQGLTRGELTAEDYDRLVQLYKPVTPYDFVPEPARPEDALRALTENKRSMFGRTDEIQPGERADLRLDIPAYRDHGVWVNSIHRKDAPTVYGSVSSVRNAQMIGSPDKALKVATGETPKAPFAVIRGEWNPMSEEEAVRAAQQYLNHPEWRQVGYDPERHGYFYDRATMEPILGAEEVIQIGPLVLARKPQLGAKSEQKYQSGGLSTAMRRK